MVSVDCTRYVSWNGTLCVLVEQFPMLNCVYWLFVQICELEWDVVCPGGTIPCVELCVLTICLDPWAGMGRCVSWWNNSLCWTVCIDYLYRSVSWNGTLCVLVEQFPVLNCVYWLFVLDPYELEWDVVCPSGTNPYVELCLLTICARSIWAGMGLRPHRTMPCVEKFMLIVPAHD